MFSGFKKFITRGNVVDLAVGVLIGAAFQSVVNSLVKDILTPFIAAIVHVPDFSKLAFTFRGSIFMYGDFVNNLISFFISALTIYFFVVLPINKFNERRHSKEAPADPTTKKCPRCLSEIPIPATKCAFCTADL